MNSKLLHVWPFLVLLGTAVPPAAAAEAHQLALTVGAQQELVWEKGLDRLAIGDPAVADTVIMKAGKSAGDARVLVVGKAPGRTTLMIWPKGQKTAISYDVQVSGAASASLLGADAKSRVDAYGKTVVIDGVLPDMASHNRIAGVANEAAGKPVLVDRSTVAVKSNTVQVDVKVVEFSKSVLKEAGFNIFTNRNGFGFGAFAPGGLKSMTGGGSLDPIAFTGASPLTQAFNLVLSSSRSGIVTNLGILEGNGLARVLAEPTLVALSGQSASFLAGGEIPVPVPQAFGTVSIQYKPFGIGLMLTPTVLSNDRIALKVAPEASDLDFSNAVTLNGVSVPAITTRRADTMVELGDGESFVIGGLVSRTTVSDLDKIPMLGDIPVLGAFFKRQHYQQNERELVIVVTPHLVKPIAKATDLQPLLPGRSEQREGAVWQSYLAGAASRDALPGFSD
ncbi:type II and III secretion system protein family protein [Variovorax terrae]|uniref:Type II and III secretion system protein family protein n=1 Tax=Variovorax terrae TaxID=2923278 RepID=A0A9X1W0M6_9BURK|nr:type II and III secretion system protein family protein [Variovorax terrae]MCJ0763913.1 type II and III secretion system protein family protein [Variovorax terrae]